jgi:DNA processing protein
MLLDALGSPEAIFAASVPQLIEASGMAPAAAERLLAQASAPCDADLAAMERLGVDLIPWGDACYPPLLREIADPPCALYVRGTLELRDRTAVAVVGTRTASPYAREVAEAFGRQLARAGLTVVSGLARGIDTRAHAGALAAGGRTLAVLGSGLDILYPAENARLAEQIAAQGALLSEYPMGSGPESWRFPARNRILSGLSLGTLVVEGRWDWQAKGNRSGALITSDFALEQGREVFAIPGDIRNPRTSGPHRLIQEGAKLVARLEDILTELRIGTPAASAPAQLTLPEISLSEGETRVLNSLGLQPRHIDDLIAESGLPAGQVSSSLLTLELKGLVAKRPGGNFVRVHRSGAA